MPKEQVPGKPTSRRYSPEEKAAAVRMVRALRAELGTDHGTVHRVARQLGYGVESVRSWMRQATSTTGIHPACPPLRRNELRNSNRKSEKLSAPTRF